MSCRCFVPHLNLTLIFFLIVPRRRDKLKNGKQTLPKNRRHFIKHVDRAIVQNAPADAAIPAESTLKKRYQSVGLAFDANRVVRTRAPGKIGAHDVAGGAPAAIAAMKERLATETRDVSGTLLREPELPAEHRVRVSGAQARYLSALRAKHGEDLAAMRRDSYLNYDQLSEGQLRRLFVKFDQVYPPGRPIPEVRLKTYANAVLDELAEQVVQDFKRRRVGKKVVAESQSAATTATEQEEDEVEAATTAATTTTTPAKKTPKKAASKKSASTTTTPVSKAATTTTAAAVPATTPRKRKAN